MIDLAAGAQKLRAPVGSTVVIRMAGKGDCPWMVWQHERIEPAHTPCCP